MTIEEMAVKVAEVDARAKSNTHRIADLEEQSAVLNKLATAMEVMATEQKHQGGAIKKIETDLNSIGQKVEAVEQKPGKRWEGIVDKIIHGIVGGIVTALVAGAIYLLTVAG